MKKVKIPYIGGPYDGETVEVPSPPSPERRIPYPLPGGVQIRDEALPTESKIKVGIYVLKRHVDDYYQAYVWKGEP